jgi:hypothetical protein
MGISFAAQDMAESFTVNHDTIHFFR